MGALVISALELWKISHWTAHPERFPPLFIPPRWQARSPKLTPAAWLYWTLVDDKQLCRIFLRLHRMKGRTFPEAAPAPFQSGSPARLGRILHTAPTPRGLEVPPLGGQDT